MPRSVLLRTRGQQAFIAAVGFLCGAFWLGLGCAEAEAEAEPHQMGQAPVPIELPRGFWEYWGDGQAEISTYALKQPRYGEIRGGEVVVISVTETINPKTGIKSDSNEGVPAFKINEVRDFSTGIYDYNAMTTSLVPLDPAFVQGLPNKVSVSLQEWCGQVFEQLLIGDRSMSRSLRSYWEEEGDRDEDWERPNVVVFADVLPFLARGFGGPWMRPGEEREVRWLPSLLERRLQRDKGRFMTAKLQRSAGNAEMEVPAGRFSAYTISVQPERGPSTIWYFQEASPHRLLGWTRSDGEEARLLASERQPYWKQNAVADKGARESLGLLPHRWPEGR